MAGLIQQLTDITLTATPSVGSYLLSIDLDGILKYKTDTGTISPVGFGGGSGSVNQIAFGTNTGLTSSPFFTIDSNDIYLIFGSNSISGTSSNSSIIGGRGSEINNSQNSIILGGGYYSGTPTYGSSGGNQIIGGKNNFVTGGFYCNSGGTTSN